MNIDAKSLLRWSGAAFIALLLFGPNALYLVGALFLLKLYFEYSERKEEEQQASVYEADRKIAAQELHDAGLKLLGDNGEILGFESEFDANKASGASAQMQVISFKSWHFVVCGGSAEKPLDASKIAALNNYLERWVVNFDCANSFPTRKGKFVPESEQSTVHSLGVESELHKRKLDEAMRRAADIRARTKSDAGPNATALYIMNSEAGTKVGFSANPKRRLSQLKTTHPGNLMLHRTWWFESREDASNAEKNTHRLLKAAGVHINREWFSASIEEAERVVNKVIDEIEGVHEPR